MIFNCVCCARTKIGKYELLRYAALDENGERKVYEGKVCKSCTKTIEEIGLNFDHVENEESTRK